MHQTGTVSGDARHITAVPVRSLHSADKFLMITSLFSSAGNPLTNSELN